MNRNRIIASLAVGALFVLGQGSVEAKGGPGGHGCGHCCMGGGFSGPVYNNYPTPYVPYFAPLVSAYPNSNVPYFAPYGRSYPNTSGGYLGGNSSSGGVSGQSAKSGGSGYSTPPVPREPSGPQLVGGLAGTIVIRPPEPEPESEAKPTSPPMPKVEEKRQQYLDSYTDASGKTVYVYRYR